MLVRSDPFRQFDRLAEQVFGTVARPSGDAHGRVA